MQPMSDPLVNLAVQEDPTALKFLQDIARVLHTYDDLIDGDQPLSDADVHTAFWLALIEIPNNAFYMAHRSELQPILVNAIVNWRVANEIERGRAGRDAELLKISFITRSAYVDLLIMSAVLIGGIEWGVQQGIAIREWAHSETFNGYLVNLAAEKAAREGENNVL